MQQLLALTHFPTRVFVSLLSHALKIPVLGLCDCNPFGLSIMVRASRLHRQPFFDMLMHALAAYVQTRISSDAVGVA